MSARIALWGLLVLAMAFVAWRWLAPDSPQPVADLPVSEAQVNKGAEIEALGEDLVKEISRLRAELALESAARRDLAKQLASLREKIEVQGTIVAEAFPESLDTEPYSQFSASQERESFSSRSETTQAEDANAAYSETSSEPPVFDTDALISQVGLYPEDALRLRERWEQFSLDRLELLDRANREGWRFKPRFRREAANLEVEVFEDIGEEGFDQLLYASGRPNRVVVRDVLEYSTAERAGLKAGDIILRYDDRAMFDSRRLQAATSHGRLGESVRVDLLRDGEVLTVDVERGPLGTLLRASSEPPILR